MRRSCTQPSPQVVPGCPAAPWQSRLTNKSPVVNPQSTRALSDAFWNFVAICKPNPFREEIVRCEQSSDGVGGRCQHDADTRLPTPTSTLAMCSNFSIKNDTCKHCKAKPQWGETPWGGAAVGGGSGGRNPRHGSGFSSDMAPWVGAVWAPLGAGTVAAETERAFRKPWLSDERIKKKKTLYPELSRHP